MEVFLSNSIEFGVIFLLGCLGEILIEKSGHLNLGIPGIMCVGAAGGCLGVKIYMAIAGSNPIGVFCVLFAIIFAVLFSGLLGGIYAFFTVSLRVNQNVMGLAVTIFGAGFAKFFLNTVVLTGNTASHLTKAGKNFFKWYPPFFDGWGWFGQIFLSHGVFVYIAIILAVLCALMLNKTKVGLNLRSIGESPATADAVGLNVTAYKYVFILIGSAIAGLGGLTYVMEYMGGIVGATVDETIQGIGWLAIALVIFTMWKPALAIFGSIVFGALYIAPSYITGVTFSQINLVKMIPYAVTIIVLIFTSIRGKRENMPPASLGLSYFREDR